MSAVLNAKSTRLFSEGVHFNAMHHKRSGQKNRTGSSVSFDIHTHDPVVAFRDCDSNQFLYQGHGSKNQCMVGSTLNDVYSDAYHKAMKTYDEVINETPELDSDELLAKLVRKTLIREKVLEQCHFVGFACADSVANAKDDKSSASHKVRQLAVNCGGNVTITADEAIQTGDYVVVDFEINDELKLKKDDIDKEKIKIDQGKCILKIRSFEKSSKAFMKDIIDAREKFETLARPGQFSDWTNRYARVAPQVIGQCKSGCAATHGGTIDVKLDVRINKTAYDIRLNEKDKKEVDMLIKMVNTYLRAREASEAKNAMKKRASSNLQIAKQKSAQASQIREIAENEARQAKELANEFAQKADEAEKEANEVEDEVKRNAIEKAAQALREKEAIENEKKIQALKRLKEAEERQVAAEKNEAEKQLDAELQQNDEAVTDQLNNLATIIRQRLPSMKEDDALIVAKLQMDVQEIENDWTEIKANKDKAPPTLSKYWKESYEEIEAGSNPINPFGKRRGQGNKIIQARLLVEAFILSYDKLEDKNKTISDLKEVVQFIKVATDKMNLDFALVDQSGYAWAQERLQEAIQNIQDARKVIFSPGNLAYVLGYNRNGESFTKFGTSASARDYTEADADEDIQADTPAHEQSSSAGNDASEGLAVSSKGKTVRKAGKKQVKAS